MKDKKYGYYHHVDDSEDRSGLCGDMSFTAAEAYKLLRTKINLIIPNEITSTMEDETHKCRIIGVTSSLAGEGKTTNSINLAYSLAEAKQKVCLLEADMRLPVIGKRLQLELSPGLSNLLSGQCEALPIVQKYVGKNDVPLYVVTAGDVPPTPAELLGSVQMINVLELFSKVFDVIVIDLPPVTVVTDALIVAPRVNGIVLVVRQNYCDKRALQETVEQFTLTDTKILGIVYNGIDGPATLPGYYKSRYKYGKYGKYGRYSKYGKYSKYSKYNKYSMYNKYYKYGREYAESAESMSETNITE